MKLALISPYRSVASHGIRSLSAYLKQQGVYVNVFFLCLDMDAAVPAALCEKLAAFLKKEDFDLVGISLSSNYFNIASSITKYIKARLGLPVIWGGIHPTISPEESLQFADMACIGYGEVMLTELCKRISDNQDYSDVNNLCFKDNSGLRRNQIAPLNQELDWFPFPDYDFSGHFIWDNNDFHPMEEGLFKKYQYIPDRYETLGSRGCPYQCSYCCNNSLQRLYGSKGFLRMRSPGSIIKELRIIRDKFPFIRSIYFDDDAMFSRNMEEISLFCSLYKEKIGLPFRVSGVYPLALTEEKLKLFVDAGLKRIKMGIQTGSQRIAGLYKRAHIKKERIVEAARVINAFKDKMEPPIYDFILDNPYEREEDSIETLKLLSEIPKPYELCLFSLTFFPGNEITERALKDGLIREEDLPGYYSKDHNRPSRNYFSLLIRFFELYNCPPWLKEMMIEKRAAGLNLQHLFITWIELVFLMRRSRIISQKLTADLRRLDFSRIRRKIGRYRKKIIGRSPVGLN